MQDTSVSPRRSKGEMSLKGETSISGSPTTLQGDSSSVRISSRKRKIKEIFDPSDVKTTKLNYSHLADDEASIEELISQTTKIFTNGKDAEDQNADKKKRASFEQIKICKICNDTSGKLMTCKSCKLCYHELCHPLKPGQRYHYKTFVCDDCESKKQESVGSPGELPSLLKRGIKEKLKKNASKEINRRKKGLLVAEEKLNGVENESEVYECEVMDDSGCEREKEGEMSVDMETDTEYIRMIIGTEYRPHFATGKATEGGKVEENEERKKNEQKMENEERKESEKKTEEKISENLEENDENVESEKKIREKNEKEMIELEEKQEKESEKQKKIENKREENENQNKIEKEMLERESENKENPSENQKEMKREIEENGEKLEERKRKEGKTVENESDSEKENDYGEVDRKVGENCGKLMESDDIRSNLNIEDDEEVIVIIEAEENGDEVEDIKIEIKREVGKLANNVSDDDLDFRGFPKREEKPVINKRKLVTVKEESLKLEPEEFEIKPLKIREFSPPQFHSNQIFLHTESLLAEVPPRFRDSLIYQDHPNVYCFTEQQIHEYFTSKFPESPSIASALLKNHINGKKILTIARNFCTNQMGLEFCDALRLYLEALRLKLKFSVLYKHSICGLSSNCDSTIRTNRDKNSVVFRHYTI